MEKNMKILIALSFFAFIAGCVGQTHLPQFAPIVYEEDEFLADCYEIH
jgi:hypothetical protein